MLVSSGAAVKVTATNTLSAADVEFADGGILKVACAEGGTVNPLTITGDLWLPDGTVTVDFEDGEPQAWASLVTWTGKVRARGETLFVPANPRSKQTFRLDEANRRLIVIPVGGTMVIFR